MKHHIKENTWSCTALSFAMVLDVEPQWVYDQVGHDGSQVLAWSAKKLIRRGFPIQEMIHLALQLGYSVTPYQMIPQTLVQPKQVFTLPHRQREFLWWLKTSKGVLTGEGYTSAHAVAFNHGDIYDPEGDVYPATLEVCREHRFYPREAWIVQ